MTSLPPPDEPHIHETLIAALIAASTAHLEASSYFEAALPHLGQARELDDQSQVVRNESIAAIDRAADLMLEVAALVQEDPPGNITQAIALMSDVKDADRRAPALSAGAAALTRQASVELEQGLTIWHEGTQALRVGLERASTLLQEGRRRQTNGDAPDALTA